MARPEIVESWLPEAVELMARKGIDLRDAVAELDLLVDGEKIKTIERRKSFDRLVWEARHRYYNDLATNPNFKKDTIIGRFLAQAQRLEAQGDYDKAAEVLFKAAKAAGFVGVEGQVNIFGELSQADLDEIRKKVEKDFTSVTTRPN